MDAVHVFTNNVFGYSAILTYMEEGYYLNLVSYFRSETFENERRNSSHIVTSLFLTHFHLCAKLFFIKVLYFTDLY